ncbi:MAG TPA: hypothetical protein PLI45_04290 [Candidatus Woesebacteria bacterium]|nr:hypothetical protein [Candidatus Woesebacteria bacterium]
MRQKNTIYSPEFHNQFQETPDEIRHGKEEKAEHAKNDQRQGQSDFWIKKKTSIKGQPK